MGIAPFLPLLALIIIGLINYSRTCRKKDARTKVEQYTEQGVQANVCSKCEGLGKVGFFQVECPDCKGDGYIIGEDSEPKEPKDQLK